MHLCSSCERDDICAEDTPTTPFLIIKFMDFDTPTDIKQPDELQVKAEGFENIITYETNQDSILIPLRTNALLTNFELTINSDTEDGGDDPNTDVINIVYAPVEEYVSSACGFRVIYNELGENLIPEGDQNWIKNIIIEEPDVIDETNAHILIFH
ncbi:DUF6452 family protein [Aquimarina litoralis]|uniref:DUF6452 family protein n=2 Tax=Aquimarina litoralis TaxID=584605 RepID=A0ABN1IYV8_9FLAO